MKIVILGGGPCGLGAAWRLHELGHTCWRLYESQNHWGGLSTSFIDQDGFVWDLGGHVLFSHYRYFDQTMDQLLGKKDGWVFHERESWIWIQDRFIPYPLQNNIHHFPKDIFWQCLEGIIDIHENRSDRKPLHFGQWIDMTFGKGLAKWFLRPYNYKVWAYPVEEMDWSWVGDRVAPVDLKRIIKNAVYNRDDISWGPNSRFRFPLHGGTGAIWKRLAQKLPQDNLCLNQKAKKIDIRNKTICFSDDQTDAYDVLLSTIPLTSLVRIADIDMDVPLKWSSTHIVGLALKGQPPERLRTKCWMYFPEDDNPFYRVTVFSNYSPENVPDSTASWSLMLEVSESPRKKVNHATIVEDVINGALNTRLISSRKEIDHTWYQFIKQGYPTPGLGRNNILFPALIDLQNADIYSRGRFGAWRYEVGNMDHSFMQGVEWVNSLMTDGEELTLWYPEIVNSPHPAGMKR